MFKYLGLKKNEHHGLVPYYLDDVNNVCPSMFNDIRTVGDIWVGSKGKVSDPYNLNSGLPVDGQIPAEYAFPILIFESLANQYWSPFQVFCQSHRRNSARRHFLQ